MNILYICNPDSIHDQKWMRFFAEKDDFQVFAVGESVCNERIVEDLFNQNIILLPFVDTFSIKTPLRNYQSIIKLRHYCREYQIDLIHVLFAAPYALWTNYLDKPYIITTRGSDVLVVLPELKNKIGLKGLYFNWLFKKFKKAFEGAKVITSTSELQIQRIKELFSVDSQLVRTGVDVDKIQSINAEKHLPTDLNGKQFIFSPRFMSPIYNIAYQIDAIKLLSEAIRESFYFVFVRGKQYDQDYYDMQLSALKENNKIKFIIFEYLDQESLWATFKKASLAIMTPVSDGTPNSALEAMAANCPLILSDLPYDKDLFENTCEKIQITNPKILAMKIEQTLLSINQFNQIALKAVSIYGNRTSEMKKMESLYKYSISN